MNLRATAAAAAAGVLLTAAAAGTATARTAGHEAAPGTDTGTGSDSVAVVKHDRLTPSSVVDYVLDADES
jgi:adenosylcobinamide amidohydrolase